MFEEPHEHCMHTIRHKGNTKRICCICGYPYRRGYDDWYPRPPPPPYFPPPGDPDPFPYKPWPRPRPRYPPWEITYRCLTVS
jgi:hypothetical protein